MIPTQATVPLPETGYLRLQQIIGQKGDPNAKPPKPHIPAIFPVSKSLWWDKVNKGVFPAPVKLTERTTAWRVEDIRALIASIGKGE